MPSSQPLPPKEKALFNRILKCYEHKQYKNGLKFAKQILSNPKFAEHGETLAMKGLILSCTGKKEEAYELVKKGLKNDLKSHVCWHVYGLLQRSDKKYDEAIKCYRNALRWDKENLHILRDLSMLQIHMRDLEGYMNTRLTLLQLKYAQRVSWIGYAIARHLLKEYDGAYKVLAEFFKTHQIQEGQYEDSELLLYQTNILMEAGKHQEALDHLEKHQFHIMDKLTLLETKGDLLVLLGRLKEAEDLYTDLIHRNPENHRYFSQLEKVLKPSNVEERLQIYQAVSDLFPKADSPKLLPLSFTSGSTFRFLVAKFMQAQLKRGVPPLFITLKHLYSDPEKVKTIADVLCGFITSLEAQSKFYESDIDLEPPTTLLWAKYYYAQHLDAIKDHDKALAILDECLEHTPTLIELHVTKAKVLKHMGDMPAAVESIDEAQSLDTADRFINCKCACYMIRNGMISEAEEIASKFTRENVSVDEYLREMQCMWYEIECAASYAKSKKLGEALKKCHEVDRHFSEIVEDQFDFHQYCMRKMTLRSYVQMLKLEDSLRSHKFYYQAARIAIKVYIHLHDEPYKPEDVEQDQNLNLSRAELRKLKYKQKREKKKAEAQQRKQQEEKASKKKPPQKNQKNDEEQCPKKEDDLKPEKLVSVTDPLEQALKFLFPLELRCSSRCDTHLLAFQVAERRGKMLVMLRALLRAEKTASPSDEPDLHLCKVHFAKIVRDANGVSSHVNDVIVQHLPKLYGDSDVKVFSEEFLKENPESMAHLFAAAKAMYYLDNSKKDDALDLILTISKDMKNVSLQLCEMILDSLKGKLDFGEVPEDIIKSFTEKSRDLYPRARAFLPNDKRQKKDSSMEVNGKPVNGVPEHNANNLEEVGGDAGFQRENKVEAPPETSENAGHQETKKHVKTDCNLISESAKPVENHCSEIA